MKANKLQNKDYIGVFAPSSAVKEKNVSELEKSKRLLKNYGLKTVYGKNLYSNELGYSATVESKIQDLKQLLNNKNVKGIIFAKGC